MFTEPLKANGSKRGFSNDGKSLRLESAKDLVSLGQGDGNCKQFTQSWER